MQTVQSNGVTKLTGTMIVPGDKSISHRAVMFGSLAHGKTIVNDLLTGDDCLNTIDCFKKLGVDIQLDGNRVEINGKGIEGLEEPSEVLDVGNSGTTIRLLLGILANLPFSTTVIGDASIAKRPMGRVTVPLKQMGAKIDGRNNGEYTPLHIRGGNLKGIEYESPVASAQVKSAILLAGLTAEGETAVVEPEDSRNHTERMLRAFGFDVKEDGLRKSLVGGGSLTATTIDVPGDISSAAFFLVAAAILPGSELLLKNVGMNETRTGIIDVLQAMGAKIEITNLKGEDLEPSADLLISHSSLNAIEIGGEIIPRLIDEIPIIALAASQAEGVTVIKDAEELKVKETNRIDAVVEELSQMGVEIEATDDGMKIHGKKGQLQPTNGDSRGDHRIGMMLAIAGLLANGETTIANSDAISISYPGFFEQLEQLRK